MRPRPDSGNPTPSGAPDRSGGSGLITPRRRKAPRYKDTFRNNRRGTDAGQSSRIFQAAREDQSRETDSKQDTLRIIPLGGLGEVGRNMCVMEYKNDIIIIDVGFGFPKENMPGIDYVLPNTSYLEGKQDRIKGILLTHGHMDHVGAIPYLIERLGNPPIYTANLTSGMVIKRQMEFPDLPELDLNIVKAKDTIKLGQYFEVTFLHVNHNIPDDVALIIKTPSGTVVHTADFKFDKTPLNEAPADLEEIRSIGDDGVSLLMIDSTGAEKEGNTISETTIQDNLEVIFQESTGMIITGTFSSLINRIQQLITLAEKYGRHVIFDGFSLKSNIEMAKKFNQIRMKKDTQIPITDIDRYPRGKVILIGTGAQGEGSAVLMRIASGEHPHVQIKKGDTVVFSSSVIPGNERGVQDLKDLFYRMGARVYHSGMMDIHASGHAQKEDLRLMMQLIRPKILMPIHGQYSMMVNNKYIGQEEGIKEENIIIADNGSVIHLSDPTPANKAKPAEWWFDRKTVPSEHIMVDGLGVGDIGNVVLRDRQVLAEDGMFVLVALVDSKTSKVITSPEIISRGFVYLKENKELLFQVRKMIRNIIEHKTGHPFNAAYAKDMLRDDIGLFLFQRTERRPMILPVIIEL